MELLKIFCPDCKGTNVTEHTVYQTKNNGNRRIYHCKGCSRYFSETKSTFMERIRKPISLIICILKARLEGMGLNAASRVHEVSKNTIMNWENRFASIKKVLLVYALVHQFLQMIIEGDEIYTKVNKNVPPDQSEGWTIVLMDRVRRFILELKWGRKDRKLFRNALRTLCKLIEKTRDLSLITDGERRYGNILFEICHDLVRTGKRGPRRKTLPKGVKVRIKNKGSQSHKKGRKRPKYQAPCPEHPETVQNLGNKDIHANHNESFNSSLRRKNAAFRRKTNTYAKKKDALQRTLDVYWVIHNFVLAHFTTQRVPAVALGILQNGLSWEEVLMIRTAA